LIVNLSLAAALSLGSTSGLAANISLAPLDGDPVAPRMLVSMRPTLKKRGEHRKVVLGMPWSVPI
jgi:hypothetical protein